MPLSTYQIPENHDGLDEARFMITDRHAGSSTDSPGIYPKRCSASIAWRSAPGSWIRLPLSRHSPMPTRPEKPKTGPTLTPTGGRTRLSRRQRENSQILTYSKQMLGASSVDPIR